MEQAVARPWSRAGRAWAAAVTAAAVLAVLLPLTRSPGRDSFPLSTYPMFTAARGPVTDIDVVVGVAADGSQQRLSPEVIAATDEVIQAAALVTAAVRSGPEATARLCTDAARRVEDADVVAVEVRTDSYDTVAWFRGDRRPRSTQTHAACPVQ